jgi:Fe2+ or Zn2+ uptake regulation protein
MNYYNTTSLSSGDLDEATYKAETQEDLVFDFFLKNNLRLTPDQVHEFCLQDAPLTSVRRALTNLTKQGLLKKTDQKSKGRYGRDCHVWGLSKLVIAVIEAV